jgi:hypothetical protein
MNLTNIEKKLLMLAMDKAAQEHEVAAAARKFILSMRKRYPSGIELIDALEGKLYVPPFPSMTQPFQQAPPSPYHPPQYQQSANEWQDIMREAQRMAAQRMAAAQAQRQQTWEEWCESHGFHPHQKAEPPPKKGGVVPPSPKDDTGTGIVEKIKKMFSP